MFEDLTRYGLDPALWRFFQPECWRSVSGLNILREKGCLLPVFAIHFTEGSLCSFGCHDERIL